MIQVNIHEDKAETSILINGIEFPRPGWLQVIYDDTNAYEFSILNSKAIELIIGHCFSELPSVIKKWDLHIFSKEDEEGFFYELYREEVQSKMLVDSFSILICRETDDQFEVGFGFILELTQWRNAWSVAEYVEKFSQIAGAQVSQILVGLESVHDIELMFSVTDPLMRINTATTNYYSMFIELHRRTILALEEIAQGRSIIMRFNFPPSVKVACEQYLLYFVEFLRDAGIEATSQIREEAGEVLFSVTPLDETEALYRIRQALELYLQIPTRIDVNLPVVYDANVRELALASQVNHLMSQLNLAAATLRARDAETRAMDAEIAAKDATIQAQQLTISQQQQLITGEVLLNSVKYVIDHYEDKDEEEIVKGFSLTTVEKGGVKISLAELMREAKRRFSRGDTEKDDA